MGGVWAFGRGTRIVARQIAMSRQTTRNTITLRGSAQIVGEFFGYAVNRCALGAAGDEIRREKGRSHAWKGS